MCFPDESKIFAALHCGGNRQQSEKRRMIVDSLLQRVDASFFKPAAEVARGRRIRGPRRPQRIEIPLVSPQKFQVLQPGVPRQQVVRDVQDVIRFVVRQVDLRDARGKTRVPGIAPGSPDGFPADASVARQTRKGCGGAVDRLNLNS